MNRMANEVLAPVMALFPEHREPLQDLLGPCVGHTFTLRPPLPNLADTVERAVGVSHWVKELNLSPVLFASHEPVYERWSDETGDVLGSTHLLPYYAMSEFYDEVGYEWQLERYANELPDRSSALTFFERWRQLPGALWDDLLHAVDIEFRERLRRRLDPQVWRTLRTKLGDQLEDGLADSLLGWPIECWRALQFNLRSTLKLAIGFTALGKQPEATRLRVMLHELWLKGNYPLTTTWERQLEVVCRHAPGGLP